MANVQEDHGQAGVLADLVDHLSAVSSSAAAATTPVSVYVDVERKLERLFDRFCAGKISINIFIEEVRAEREALHKRAKAMTFGWRVLLAFTPGYRAERLQLAQALEAATWCLEWGMEHRREDLASCLDAFGCENAIAA